MLFLFFSMVGFLLGGGIGVLAVDTFFPGAWIGLAVGIVLWLLIKLGGGAAGEGLDIGFDAFD